MSTTPYAKTAAAGAQFAHDAKLAGFTVNADGGIVRIRKSFEAADVAAYAETESQAYDLLGAVPTVASGSIWGDFGDGVGGAAALARGSGSFKVSGASKNFVKGIAAAA